MNNLQLRERGTFTVLLPVTKPATAIGKAPVLPCQEIPKHRILLVEDEERVGCLTERLLTRFGYGVATVAEGDQAIAAYAAALATAHPFELVLTDLALSGDIGGEEVMDAILKLSPGAKGVVTSGHYEQAAFKDFRKHGFCGAIRKPYRIKDLQQVVHAALNQIS
jgi:two-component system cell cycle sensor histidine kinase/response regulator CckA